jgi:hypothetical protein
MAEPANQHADLSKNGKNTKIPVEKGGPMGGHNEYRRTGNAPNDSNTGATGKPTTPYPW